MLVIAAAYHHNKFIAADSEDRTVLVYLADQATCCLNRFISEVMPSCVVYLFQVVDITHNYPELQIFLSGTDRSVDYFLIFLISVTVFNTGQFITSCHEFCRQKILFLFLFFPEFPLHVFEAEYNMLFIFAQDLDMTHMNDLAVNE